MLYFWIICIVKIEFKLFQRNDLVKLREYAHIFDAWTNVKWGFPNFYRKPGLGYQKIGTYHLEVTRI